MTTKQWTKPQLIVLSRGTPEESVLLQCKLISMTGQAIGPTNAAQEICVDVNKNGKCGACQARGSS